MTTTYTTLRRTTVTRQHTEPSSSVASGRAKAKAKKSLAKSKPTPGTFTVFAPVDGKMLIDACVPVALASRWLEMAEKVGVKIDFA